MDRQQEVRHFVLRCLAYPGVNDGKEGFYAVCIDLSLVIWRPTLEAARKSLNEAIYGYAETINDLVREGKDVQHLVPRPVPFWPYRMMYGVYALLRVIPRVWRHFDSVLFDERSIDLPFQSVTA